MVSAISSLTIESLIFHQVPRAIKNSANPLPLTLTETAVTLNTEQRLYMQERLKGSLSLQRQAREVQESKESVSPVPELLRSLLISPTEDFVAPSQLLAKHLREVQDGGSPNGLFMFGRCLWAGKSSVVVAKVELERGIQAKQVSDEAGKLSFNLALLNDLVFGQTSRIYKIGLFSSADLMQPENLLHGIAVDEQIGGSGVTKLFLLDYLGCEYVENSSELTKKYYESSIEFFSKKVTLPTDKSKYLIALVSDLESRKSTIDVKKFAHDHLSDDDQQSYLSFLKDSGLHSETFSKSVEYISISKLRYETDTGVVIIAPPSKSDERIINVRDKSVIVKGQLKQVGTQGTKGVKKNVEQEIV